jgi:colanic acid/amylovoran biosynthesis glycosyltransferase
MTKTVVHYKAGPFLPLTENWLHNQITRLNRYRPIVYCHNRQNIDLFPTPRIRSLGLKTRRYPWTWFNNNFNDLFDFYPAFPFFLRQDRPDLVHAQFGPAGYGFLRLKRKFRLPMITSFYGYDVSMLPTRYPACLALYARLFESGELFLAEGPHMQGRLIELGCPEERILVQRLGIDLERIACVPRRVAEDEVFRVLVSAGFREKKGIPDAVAAFGQVQAGHPGLKMQLTIVGDSLGYPEMEAEKERIMRTIEEYRLGDQVNLMGFQPYPVFLAELYRHHVFLSPSITASDGDTEGGAPVSLIEATASGMPVLATSHCDIPQIIRDGENGFLVPEADVEGLAERLSFLAAHPENWEGMGRRGRRHVEEDFEAGRQGRLLEEAYDSVLAGTDPERHDRSGAS